MEGHAEHPYPVQLTDYILEDTTAEELRLSWQPGNEREAGLTRVWVDPENNNIPKFKKREIGDTSELQALAVLRIANEEIRLSFWPRTSKRTRTGIDQSGGMITKEQGQYRRTRRP